MCDLRERLEQIIKRNTGLLDLEQITQTAVFLLFIPLHMCTCVTCVNRRQQKFVQLSCSTQTLILN